MFSKLTIFLVIFALFVILNETNGFFFGRLFGGFNRYPYYGGGGGYYNPYYRPVYYNRFPFFGK